MAKKQTVPGLAPVEPLHAVPGNWRWLRLGDITDIVGGGTPATKNAEFYENGTVPWITPADLSAYTEKYISHGSRDITDLGLEKSSAQLLPKNTVCLSTRAPIGYVVIAQNPLSTNQGFKNFLPSPVYLPSYLFWYLKGNKDLLEERASGTTFLELSGRKAAAIEFPVPPIPEQQRIVDRIESLFAMMDEARDKAQAVVDGYELRRAAILHKAFTGELTAKWREERNISLNSWQKVKLSDVATLQTGLMKGKRYNDSEITTLMPYLRVANVQDGFLNLDEIKQIEVPKALIGRYLLKDGDVLFTEGGDYDKLGRGTVWRGEIKDCLHQNHVFAVRTNATVLIPTFLSYQAGSLYGRRYFLSCSKQTVNLASINSTQLKKFPVILPSKEEQIEIVRIIDTTLLQEQQTRASAEKVLETIGMMKKKILGLAFRGLLGTNDPSEPCVETGGNIGCP